MNDKLEILTEHSGLTLKFKGEFNLYKVSNYEAKIKSINYTSFNNIVIDLNDLTFFDTTAAIFLEKFMKSLETQHISFELLCNSDDILDTINLVKKYSSTPSKKKKKKSFLEAIGKRAYNNFLGFMSFFAFLGKLFSTKLHLVKNLHSIRYKETAFEINESAVKALGIIALTSFLIGLVVAYQGAYQLKTYGANIFIVDMLGISIMRELAPIITAIVIAGRSGSAYTAQIGAMKITEELDAMRTMGFDPYLFLVLPRIIALMIMMPILIFISDIMAIIGGMIVANIDLDITVNMFLDRFLVAIDVRHFYVGIVKGPFFAFLIATIAIYRGMAVKDDTQSIGFNTTKSVVESIFAVIMCDAIFSIIFTNLGI
ncbi:ABC transporter permease [Sulfurimonas sp.]|uniref:ABC transporter permease n=1 Tax=Sulfurimonas sp. TaxID=2022749 RepID=UPI0035619DDC